MPVTYTIIGITCLISIQAWSNHRITNQLILSSYKVVQNKEWWRAIGSGFLHADYNHLFLNMLVLFFFGPFVESKYEQYFGSTTGDLLFAGMYLLAIPMASMYDIFHKKDDYSYHALGASGATSAVLYAYILLEPLGSLRLYLVIPIPAIVFGVAYLWYSSYMAKRNVDNIGHNAHFYGAIFGFAFTALLRPDFLKEFWMQIMNVFN